MTYHNQEDLGPEIPINGERPSWLGDDEKIAIGWDANIAYKGFWGEAETEVLYVSGWEGSIKSIRLPVDHFAYKAIDAGFEPWGGGDTPSEDWDGGAVLLFEGKITSNPDEFTWDRLHGAMSVIGYRKRGEAADQPTEDDSDYVRVKRMTTDEIERIIRENDHDLGKVFDQLGISKQSTIAERFAHETGITVTPEIERALSWSIERTLSWNADRD